MFLEPLLVFSIISLILCTGIIVFNILFLFLLFYRLDVYIYDYLVKKKLHATAKSFMTEGKVAPDPVGNVLYQS